MKMTVLALIVIPLLAFTLSSSIFASDAAIVSCEIITGDNSSKIPSGQHDFQIIVVSFSFNEDGSLQ